MKQCLAALLALACILGIAVQAMPAPPTTELPRLLFAEAKAIAHIKAPAQRKVRIEGLFERYFDFRAFSQLVLQDHWQALSEADRAEFLGRFRKVLVQRVGTEIPKLNRHRFSLGASRSVVLEERPAITVPVRSNKGSSTLTLWLVPGSAATNFCDLTIDDVLLSRQYRGQFNRIIRKESFSALLARLERAEVNHAEAKR